MNLTLNMAMEVAHHEAVVREAYKDSVGVWTWSVGLTNKCGHRVTRYINNPQPMHLCLKIYVWALENYAEEVQEFFHGCSLTEAQFAAALSFHWNTGALARATWAKKWRRACEVTGGHEAHQLKREAYDAFMAWRKPKSIIPRREAERELFFDGKWSNTGELVEYTKLKPDHTVDWRSRAVVDARAAMQVALNAHYDKR